MLFAEVIRKGDRVRLKRVPANRFLIVDGKPARFIAPDGTLLGIKRFIWGEDWAELEERARSMARP